MKLCWLVVLLFSLNSFAQETSVSPAAASSTVNTSRVVLPPSPATPLAEHADDDVELPAATPAPTPAPAPVAEILVPASAPVATSVVVVPAAVKPFPQFEFKSYGYINLGQRQTFKTVQNLEPYVRRDIDMAEFAFEGEFHLTQTSKIEFEIEIEHGGVGNTIEFDPMEEFGEFENEVEKGGEIALSEFMYRKSYKSNTVLKIGRFPLFISLGSVMGKPIGFPSVLVSDLVSRLIPMGWNETGVQLEQKLGLFTLRGATVNGLNSEFFRTYSWIGGGYQRQLEKVNADDLAMLASVELGSINRYNGVSVTFYRGNTTNNRYKKDKLKEDSNVTIYSAMAGYRIGPVRFLGEYIVGELENSDLVAAANTTLAGLAKPKAFAPLGSKAQLESYQLSYDITPEIVPFIKYEHVDTFAEVAGNINVNPRYNVNKKSIGLMWMWDKAAFVKAQYGLENTELAGLPETYQANLAFGFDLDSFN
jgi:hypothetical protein